MQRQKAARLGEARLWLRIRATLELYRDRRPRSLTASLIVETWTCVQTRAGGSEDPQPFSSIPSFNIQEEIGSLNGTVCNDRPRSPGNFKPYIVAAAAPFRILVKINNCCPLPCWVGRITAGSIGQYGFREVIKYGRRHEYPNRCYGPPKTHGAKKHDAEIRAAKVDGRVPPLLAADPTYRAFVGLSNFTFLLKRHTFQLVIFQSCLFAITSVILKAFIGFILAHLMHNIPGTNQRIWRGLLLVPWVIPLALSTLTWWWMFDPSYSAFNWILNQFGFASVPWLGVGWIARFCTITVNVWFGTPFFMIMYLAALKSVPEQLYEAASIDGAGAMQKLFFVTLPMMRNIIAITVLFSLIVTFADFDIVRILTAGGPQDMTHVFATYAFQVGIQSGDIPLGASVSLFMFPILAFAAFFVLRGITQRTKEIAT
jgi:multiple sugar transport system permease protein